MSISEEKAALRADLRQRLSQSDPAENAACDVCITQRVLYGTEFEIKLRNELTQKAIAKECAEWIKKKAVFKSNKSNEDMMGFMNVDDKNYMPITEFSTVGLGCERGNNAYNYIQKTEAPMSSAYLSLFDQLWNDKSRLQDVTDEVIDSITAAYNENSPDFIYFVTLYNIFNEFLEDISEDELPNEATGFKDSKIWSMLYNFQNSTWREFFYNTSNQY